MATTRNYTYHYVDGPWITYEKPFGDTTYPRPANWQSMTLAEQAAYMLDKRRNNFLAEGLNVLGTVIEFDGHQFLIGDMNLDGSSDDSFICPTESAIITRYRILLTRNIEEEGDGSIYEV